MAKFNIERLNNHSALFWGGVLSGFLFLMWLLWGMLTPFFVGFLMAYILSPLVRKLEKKGVPRWLSSLILMMGFFVFIFEFFFILVPFLDQQLSLLLQYLPFYGEQFLKRLQPLWDNVQPYTYLNGDVSQLRDAFSTPLKDIFRFALHFLLGLWTSGSVLAYFLSLLFFAPLMTFYFLKDWDRILAQGQRLIPLAVRDVVEDLVRQMDQALGNYARGQFIVCVILALYYMVGLSVIGLPFGIMLGLISGFLIFIPYVGFLTGLLLSLGVALVASSSSSLLIGLGCVYGLGQMLEGLFLTPGFVGGRTGLHPLWILFALFASGALFGLTGVIFCLPLGAIARVLVSWSVECYQQSSYYRGVEADPETVS